MIILIINNSDITLKKPIVSTPPYPSAHQCGLLALSSTCQCSQHCIVGPTVQAKPMTPQAQKQFQSLFTLNMLQNFTISQISTQLLPIHDLELLQKSILNCEIFDLAT